jgi:hypothetical protein
MNGITQVMQVYRLFRPRFYSGLGDGI